MIPRKIIQIDDLHVKLMMENLGLKEMSIRIEDRTLSGLEDTSKRFCNVRYEHLGSRIEKHIGYNTRVENPITGFENTPITSERPTHVTFIYLPNSVVEFAVRIINEAKGTDILSSVLHRFSIVKEGEDMSYKLIESLIIPYAKNCCPLYRNDELFSKKKVVVPNIPERNKTIMFIPFFIDNQEDLIHVDYYNKNEDLSFRMYGENSFYVARIYTLCMLKELINEHCICHRCECHHNC